MRASFFLALVFSASLADAQEPRSLSVEELLAQAPRLAGHRVLLTGCAINRASDAYAICSGPGRTGAVYLDGATMNRKSREEAAKYCGSESFDLKCAAVVAGVVNRERNRPQIRNAVIIWQAPERAGKWSVASQAAKMM